MDGRFATFFFIMSGLDGWLNECQTDCFAKSPATERLNVQYADLYFKEEIIGDELYVSYDFPFLIGSVQPTAGASLTSNDDAWLGFGGKWTTERVSDFPVYLELALLPGLFAQGSSPDQGFPIQFRGSLSAGYHFDNGTSVSVVFDHRSNAHFSEVNPGLNTLGIRLSYATD